MNPSKINIKVFFFFLKKIEYKIRVVGTHNNVVPALGNLKFDNSFRGTIWQSKRMKRTILLGVAQ